MVYNIEELAKRLANGESADTIAAEMADMLNAANAKVEEDNRLAMERIAKQKAERLAADKRNDMDEIVTMLAQYLNCYYPDMCADIMKDLSEDERDDIKTLIVDSIVEALDKTAEQMKSPAKWAMDPMTMMLMADVLNKKAPAPSKKPAATKSDDDILNDFLNKICH